MTTANMEASIRDDTVESRFSAIDDSGDGYNELVVHLLKSGCLTGKQVEYARRVQAKLEASRPLLQIIKELEFIDEDLIKDAVRKNPVSMRIGALLVELGHIQADDLQTALGIQA